jgi:hypothetical protein
MSTPTIVVFIDVTNSLELIVIFYIVADFVVVPINNETQSYVVDLLGSYM